MYLLIFVVSDMFLFNLSEHFHLLYACCEFAFVNDLCMQNSGQKLAEKFGVKQKLDH